MPNKLLIVENDYSRRYTKFDFTVDEGKERLNPSRDKKIRQAPQKEDGGEKNKKNVQNLWEAQQSQKRRGGGGGAKIGGGGGG